MEQQFDAQATLARVNEVAKELRKSDAYPAIIGGVAGGIAGALMAVVIAGALSSRRAVNSTPASEPVTAKSARAFAFSMQDVIKLIGIVTALMKQVQAWKQMQEKK